MRLVRGYLPAVLALLAACGGSPSVQGNSASGVNVLGEEEGSSGISVSLEDDTPENRLGRASRAQTDGDFASAISMYGALADDPLNPPQVREEALYRLGLAHAHPLNAHRDYASAVSRLEQLLAEFPDTEHRPEAEANLERYRGLVDP